MRAGVLYEEEKGGELAGLINAREGGEAKEEGYSRKEWVAEPNAQTIPDFSGKSYTQTKWDRREYIDAAQLLLLILVFLLPRTNQKGGGMDKFAQA